MTAGDVVVGDCEDAKVDTEAREDIGGNDAGSGALRPRCRRHAIRDVPPRCIMSTQVTPAISAPVSGLATTRG